MFIGKLRKRAVGHPMTGDPRFQQLLGFFLTGKTGLLVSSDLAVCRQLPLGHQQHISDVHPICGSQLLVRLFQGVQ